MRCFESGQAGIAAFDPAKRDAAKLKDAAQQFEAMMLGELLKPLQFGGAPGSDEDAASGSGASIQGFGTEALTKAIASGGGFGIARQILRQVTAEHDAQQGNGGGTKV